MMFAAWRPVLFALASLGFAGQAVASTLGAAPTWPNQYVWAIVAVFGAITTAVYAVNRERPWLRLATATVALAAIGRGIGWTVMDVAFETKLSAASVWTIVGSYALLVYFKAGRTEGS